MTKSFTRHAAYFLLFFTFAAVLVPVYRHWYASKMDDVRLQHARTDIREINLYADALGGFDAYLKYLEIICTKNSQKCR